MIADLLLIVAAAAANTLLLVGTFLMFGGVPRRDGFEVKRHDD